MSGAQPVNAGAASASRPQESAPSRVSVVVLTFERCEELATTLRHLSALPERPPLIVVDNGSTDGTAQMVARDFPQIELLRTARNLGAAARNLGVARVRTPYVAFCDDDTWWAPGALRCAAQLLDAHPRIGVVAARVLVGPQNLPDPACARMADSPLDARGLPGPRLISFMAGAAMMRVAAFDEVGGYEPRLFLGAEEALLAFDLAAAGWDMVYAEQLALHHHPSPARDGRQRQLWLQRNRLWIAWLRLPATDAIEQSRIVLSEAKAAGNFSAVLRAAVAGLPWLVRARRALPHEVLAMWRQVFGRRREPSPAPGSAQRPRWRDGSQPPP